jgi:hypothetical protein
MRLMRLAALALPLVFAACSGQPETAAAPEGPRLVLPVACLVGETCAVQTYVDRDVTQNAEDFRCGPRTNDGHDGVDFRVPDMAAQARGVDVLAAADGVVSRLRDGMADISVTAAGAPVVAGQECGNGVVIDHGGGWETQYCHLGQGSVRVKSGETVRAGQPIARIGLSGNTEYPHLHLAVRRDGVAVDPFAPDPYGEDCAEQPTLWTPQAAAQLAYRSGEVLNAGFTNGPVDMAAIEAGSLAPPDSEAPALVAFVRAIGLEQGDVQALSLKDANGAVLATSRLPPLETAKAQYMMFVGKKRPETGWPSGEYSAQYQVLRGGKVVVTRAWRIRI